MLSSRLSTMRIQVCLLLIFVVQCGRAELRKDVILNEVNLLELETSSTDFFEFIELKYMRIRSNPRELPPYRILIVEKCLDRDPEVKLLIKPTLTSLSTDNRFWVIGAEDAENIDMMFTDEANVYIPGCPWEPGQSLQAMYACMKDHLPNGIDCPVGIFLVKLNAAGYHPHWGIVVEGNRANPPQYSLDIMEEFGRELRDGLEDLLVIYGDRSMLRRERIDINERVGFFNLFVQSEKAGRKFDLQMHGRSSFVLVQPRNGFMQENKYSLGRCPPIRREKHGTKRAPYAPDFFYQTPMTPGSENDCDHNMEFNPHMLYQNILEGGSDEESDVEDDAEIDFNDYIGMDLEDSYEIYVDGDVIVEEDTGPEYGNVDMDDVDDVDLDHQPENAATEPTVKEEQEEQCGRTTPWRHRLRKRRRDERRVSHRYYSPQEKKMLGFAVRFALAVHGKDETQELSEDVINMVRDITEMARSTIFRFWSQIKRQESLEVKPKSGRPSVTTVDEFHKDSLRRTVYSFYEANEWPTLDKILAALQDRMVLGELPTMGRISLSGVLRKTGFKYSKRNNRKFMHERPDIVAMRHKYLKAIREFRREGYQIFYQDETWANAHHTHLHAWLLIEDKSSLIPQRQGTGGLKVPSGLGKRIIINHAGGPGGFLPGAGDVFIGNTGSGDYHSEMNSKHWLEWFENKLLPALPDKSVIVIDNAKYHNSITEATKTPTTAWRKDEIHEWLIEKKQKFEPDVTYLKAELLQMVREMKIEKKYVTDHLAEHQTDRNIRVLRLPIGHCELNPIELIWAQIKKKIADRNITFKLKDVFELAQAIIDEVTAEQWEATIGHAIRVEEEYWSFDQLYDDIEAEPIEQLEDLDIDEIDQDYTETSFEDMGLF